MKITKRHGDNLGLEFVKLERQGADVSLKVDELKMTDVTNWRK